MTTTSAFPRTFAQSPQLAALWNHAKDGSSNDRAGFNRAVRRFWTQVNHGNSTEAAYVRDLLILAGYQLEGGRAAPRLRATWPTKPLVPRAGLDSDLRERLLARIREANGLGKAALMNRQRADRCLSIDHIVPISHRWRGSCLDASNLQFMNQRDNSTKSDRFNL